MRKFIHFIVKFLKWLFIVIISLLLIGVIILYITDNQYVLKGIKDVYFKGRTTASITDATDFSNNSIVDSTFQPWQKAQEYNKIRLSNTLLHELKQYKTAAWVVIYKGKLFQEKYFNEYNEHSQTNSFSMAKSITTLLIGKAIEEGFIKNTNEPIIKYLPEFKNDSLAKYCKISDLTGMTSGYDWNEDYYFPIHHMAKAYYNDDIEEVIFNRKFIHKPGTLWKYQSGTTQIEGFVLQRAIKKPLATYLSEKFWKPLGMENPSLWSLDHKNGMEKSYCCIHSNAKDFAKLGQLMLQNGNWNGKQLIDSTYIKWMKTPTKISDFHYGQTIWIDMNYKYPHYMFKGHLGQYIICVPKFNLVIVRLGEQRNRASYISGDRYRPLEVSIFLDETIKNLPK